MGRKIEFIANAVSASIRGVKKFVYNGFCSIQGIKKFFYFAANCMSWQNTQERIEKPLIDLLKEVSRGKYDDFRKYLCQENMIHLSLPDLHHYNFSSSYKKSLTSPRFFNHLWAALASDKSEKLPVISIAISRFFNGKSIKELALSALPADIINLDLSRLGLNDNAAIDLAKILPGTNLECLDVRCNNIGPAGIKALAQALPGTNISHFSARGNNIGDEGAKYIADALHATKIVLLKLCNCGISAKGTKYIARALPNSPVQELYLNFNPLHDEGAKYLAELLLETSLTKLTTLDSDIGKKGMEFLISAADRTQTKILPSFFHRMPEEKSAAYISGSSARAKMHPSRLPSTWITGLFSK